MVRTRVEKAFDGIAEEFDSDKVQIIPHYKYAESLVLDFLDTHSGESPKILEIGTGTGLFASKILKKKPKASYYGVDISERMISIALSKLKKYKDKIIISKSDLNETGISGNFDVVVSFFTVQHIMNKGRLLKNIAKILNKDGVLVYVDILKANNIHSEALYMQNWRAFMKKNKCSYDTVKVVVDDHADSDIPETVERQLKLLNKAGFKEYDVLWKHEKIACFYARK